MCVVCSLIPVYSRSCCKGTHRQSACVTNSIQGILKACWSCVLWDNASLKCWQDRSGYTWISPAMQNELIQDFALTVLRYTSRESFTMLSILLLLWTKRLTPVVRSIRYVSPSLQVHETFVGFYETQWANAGTMFEIAQDVVTIFELQILNWRGQCFDSTANMAESIDGLQKRITEIQPNELFVHCMNHSLSLSF